MSEPDIHLTLLHNALRSPLGLVVATPSPRITKAALEKARSTDAELAHLRILISKTNPNGEVWIENTKVSLT